MSRLNFEAKSLLDIDLAEALPACQPQTFVVKIVGAFAVAHITRSCLEDAAHYIECPKGKCLPEPLGGLRCNVVPVTCGL